MFLNRSWDLPIFQLPLKRDKWNLGGMVTNTSEFTYNTNEAGFLGSMGLIFNEG